MIGANIGTTVTALIAALGATANAKRAAAAHILFNLLTGIVALLLLPWLIGLLSMLREWMELGEAPAAKLALFHTVFNVLGVVLIWPIADRLTTFLEMRFKTAEDDESQPRHLDKTVQAVPALALEVLGQEVRHMGSMAIAAVKAAFNDSRKPSLARRRTTVTRLAKTIADFIVRLNRAGMSQHQSERLSQILRQVRYYEAAAELAAESVASHAEANRAQHEDLPETARFTAAAKVLLSLCEQAVAHGEEVALHEALQDAEQAYQALKARLLELGLEGRLPVPVMDAQLRNASVLRRALDQVSKASRIMP